MGLALLDTSIVIAALNRDDTLHRAAGQALRAERDRHALAISALTYAEILVGPLRVGGDAVQVVERFAAQLRIIDLTPDIARLAAELRAGGRAVEVVERFAAQVRIADLSPDIARRAAELRASRGLKLPDAVIVATGLGLGAVVILTADARWKGIEKVKVIGHR